MLPNPFQFFEPPIFLIGYDYFMFLLRSRVQMMLIICCCFLSLGTHQMNFIEQNIYQNNCFQNFQYVLPCATDFRQVKTELIGYLTRLNMLKIK